MNFYDALNQGDATIREPHLTSALFYLIKQTHIENPQNSLLTNFLRVYFEELPDITFLNFDIEQHIKIEEILSHENVRKDTDITIYLNYGEEKFIINIENKISNSSYQEGQIEEQARILNIINPGYEIKNILLLPFYQNNNIQNPDQVKTIFWIGEDNSLISLIISFLNNVIRSDNFSNYLKVRSEVWIEFFTSFGNFLENDKIAGENTDRGPRNQYKYSMFEYLSQIANDWNNLFPINPNNVTVNDLLNKFEHIVEQDIQQDYPLDANLKIKKFKGQTSEAQLKIMTINEKNRIHFSIFNSNAKRLFYYPDYPNGDYNIKWKQVLIKPLHLKNELNEYLVFWKNKDTNEVVTSVYNNY